MRWFRQPPLHEWQVEAVQWVHHIDRAHHMNHRMDVQEVLLVGLHVAGRSREVMQDGQQHTTCVLQTPPHHWEWCINLKCSNHLSAVCWLQLLHCRRAGRAMETETAVFFCWEPAVRSWAVTTQPFTQRVWESPYSSYWLNTAGAKLLFGMAQLHKGLIFPNHLITSFGIRGFWSPQQLSRQGLHTAFPYCCVLCSAAAKTKQVPRVATLPYSQGCSFLPSLAPTHKDKTNWKSFCQIQCPQELSTHFIKTQVAIESSPGKQEYPSDSLREQCPPISFPPPPPHRHEPCFVPSTYTWGKGLLPTGGGQPPASFVSLVATSSSEQCWFVLTRGSLGRMLQT